MLSVDAAGPLVIGSDSKLSIKVDGNSVKIVDGKLSSGIVGSGPISVVSSAANKNTTISIAYDNNTLELKDNKLSAKQGPISGGSGIEVNTSATTAASTIAAKVDGTTIKFDSSGKLTGAYTFASPLSRNTTTGKVSLGVDNKTLVIDSATGKLRGNYEAVTGSPITVTTNKIGLNIDTNKMKITDDGKLTTLNKAIKNGDGITLSEETKDGKTIQILSAKVDGTTIIINSDGQIAQK